MKRDGPFYVTTHVNGREVEWRKPIPDPIFVHVVESHLGWRDRWRAFRHGRWTVQVSVHARADALRSVMAAVDALPDRRPVAGGGGASRHEEEM